MYVRRLIFLIVLSIVAAAQTPQGTPPEWKPVQDAMGRPGAMQPGDVLKFSLPRNDLHVTVRGIEVKAGLALGSWVAFKRAGNETMVMGDLVLRDDEVELVMSKLEQGGVEVTALHNHLLWETPRVLYMHIGGHGDAAALARTIHDALALTKTPPSGPGSAAPPTALPLDTKQLDQIMGRAGKMTGGIYQFSVPRAEKITENGMEVPTSMGVATAINFQPTGNGRAATTGDFVLLSSEVNPVIRALRDNGIAVTALHSHMLDEQPRLFFMHFWGSDDALKLARGLRAALDKINSQK